MTDQESNFIAAEWQSWPEGLSDAIAFMSTLSPLKRRIFGDNSSHAYSSDPGAVFTLQTGMLPATAAS